MADIVAWVGGTSSSNDNGGMGLKATFGTTPSNYMAANGAPLLAKVEAATYTDVDGVITKAGAFTGGASDGYKGLYCCVDDGDDASWAKDRYLITASTVNTITIDSGLGDDTVDVTIGGAFADLHTAVSGASPLIPDTTDNTHVFIDAASVQDLSGGGISVSNASRGGDLSHNKFTIWEFYNTTPGDMGNDDYGDIDGGGSLVDDVISVAADTENLVLRHFHIHGAFTSAPPGDQRPDILLVGGSLLILEHCKLSDAQWAVEATSTDTILGINTIYEDDLLGTITGGPDLYEYCCVHKVGGSSVGNGLLTGTIFDGGSNGLYGTGITMVINSTFYKQTVMGIVVQDATAGVISINNVFDLATADDNAINIDAAKGSLLVCMNNTAYSSTAGSALVNVYLDDNTTAEHAYPVDCIEVNPQLVLPSAGDYRPLNNEVLDKGRKNIANKSTVIGALTPQQLGTINRTRARYSGASHGAKW